MLPISPAQRMLPAGRQGQGGVELEPLIGGQWSDPERRRRMRRPNQYQDLRSGEHEHESGKSPDERRSAARGGASPAQPGIGFLFQLEKRNPKVAHVLEPAARIITKAPINDLLEMRGTSGTVALTGFGCSFKIAASVERSESPWKARSPVTISYRTEPKLKMSDRTSTGLASAAPGTCSRPSQECALFRFGFDGLGRRPARTAFASPSFANPKSRPLTCCLRDHDVARFKSR